MVALSEDRAGVVRSLIETAPDAAIRSLETALRGEAAGGALSAVKAIVNAEVQDRSVRDAVFEPIVPLFAPRADGFDQLQFPAAALSRLWRAMKAARPDETAYAAAMPDRRSAEDPAPPIYDELCELAARDLRLGKGEFAKVAEALSVRTGALGELIACLDLAPVARRALQHLPGWLARMTDERAAAARLTFKDAVALADDAGPRLIEILFAHLAEPWTILRVVSAVMLKPGDRYASSSELADFGARLLKGVDRKVEMLKGFDYDRGPEAGAAAAEALRVVAAVAAEFDQCLNMAKGGPWADRLAKQKQALAVSAEAHLRKVDRAVDAALPMQPVRIGGRTVRQEPRLDAPPNPLAVRRARALLTFFAGIRSTAALGGYGAMRAKVCEEVAHRLDGYVEELLAMLHSGDPYDLDNAHAFLETVADFTGLVHDEQAAQIVRRRAAAA